MKTVFVSIVAASLAGACTAAVAGQVASTGGTVAGLAMADGSTIYYGIPYAAAPAGPLRWKPPAPRPAWQGVLDASAVPPACVQADIGWNKDFVANAREDCLTVSLRAPAPTPGRALPVLVYFHGGSNAAAGAGSLADDGLHREGIVVVKPQYRLGAFGFLGLDALRAEDPHGSAGNYGLLDQIAALRWVRANIAAFGGDPGNVTISGNSAGATDALFLTLSPLARGLFQRAILQAPAPGAPRTPAQADAIGNALLERLKLPHGAAGLARLRALPFDAINAAAQNLPTPAGVDPSFLWEQQDVDGHVLPLPYAQAYRAGAGRDIAILIGSNTQELGAERRADTAPALVRAAFGRHADAALALYGYREGIAPASDPVLGSVPTQLVTDAWFRCPAYWLARQMGQATPAAPAIWRYQFGFGAPGTGKPPEHTSEMGYVYRAVPADSRAADWPPLQRYWANFIRTGDPNGPGLPHWPRTGANDALLSVEPGGIEALADPRTALCALLYRDRDYPGSPALPE